MATGYVFAGPVESFNAAEAERDDAEVVEAILRWQGDVLETKHFDAGAAITLGETDACDFMVPVNALGSEWAEVISASSKGSATLVRSPANAAMFVDSQPRDARELLDLRTGHTCVLTFGEFSLELRVVPAGRKTAVGFLESVRQSALGSVGASAMMHAAIFASLALFLPSLGNDDAESIDRDRMYTMGKLLDSAAERERERMASQGAEAASDSGQSGGQTAGESGKMGTTSKTEGHISVAGNAKPNEISLPREKQLQVARDFGMNQLVGALAMNIDDGKSIPWGDVQAGADKETHLGNMWSTDIGDASGFGWGLTGTGEGGGCQGGPCTGVGMNGISGLGIGIGKCENPPCDGLGHGHGHLGATYVPKSGPGLRWAKEIDVNGHIPAEVIQRIVRQNGGRFRNCYENGLRQNPGLTGRVAVKFIIGRDGDVSMSADSEKSDMPDMAVRACVVKSFYGITFPAPQGGTVQVTYPLMFSPSE
ncbi:MAG: AgmX/PglI C-terminal domain-containing protein [Polyangiaceae bacterium]